jgi:hypothetical protein
VLLYQVQVVAPLARTMQEQEQRPGFLPIAILGYVQKVLHLDLDGAVQFTGHLASRRLCCRRYQWDKNSTHQQDNDSQRLILNGDRSNGQ